MCKKKKKSDLVVKGPPVVPSRPTYADLENGIVAGMECLEPNTAVPYNSWEGFCLHHSYVPKEPVFEYNYASIFNHFHYYDNGWSNGLGYDFVISWDFNCRTKIWSSYRWNNQINGAHALNKKRLRWEESGKIIIPNKELIGIGVVGNFDEIVPPDFLIVFINDVIEKISENLNMEDPKIFFHNQFDYKTCPGKFMSEVQW